MKFSSSKTIGQIAQATRAKLSDETKSKLVITGVNTAEEAEPGDIVWAESAEAIAGLSGSAAAAAIVPPSVKHAPIPTLVHPLPKLVFGMLLREFVPTGEGDPKTAQIHPEAQVDPRAVICGEVKVGARTVVKAGAVLGRGVEIGEIEIGSTRSELGHA
jgi:UDP-3-O-[3-hydroxymyristoyl] glucosamine N-acyltransferase